MLPSAERTLVVSGQGYFPVALRLADGRIAVVIRGGAPHVGIKGRLDIVFSEDEGETWTTPTVVNDSPLDDRNQAVGQAANGDLVVAFWRTATYEDDGRYDESLDKPMFMMVTRSPDGGKTWSEPSEIDFSDIGNASPYGRMITMPDGSMLMNVYGETIRPVGSPVPSKKAWGSSYVYRSADHGKTWKRYGSISPPGTAFSETGLVRLNNGTLIAALRADPSLGMFLSRSVDDGKTWSEPTQLVDGPMHPADLCLLPDGRPLLVVGCRKLPIGVLGVVGDLEGNFDWKKHFLLVDDCQHGDSGYPSSVILKDGRVMTFYYSLIVKAHPEWGTHCAAVAFEPPEKSGCPADDSSD
jgi:hypothetical protein